MRILACLALGLALAAPLRAEDPPPTEHRTIRVEPAATLCVNHEPKGRDTAFQVELPSGKPALLRVSEPGYETQWRTITPSPNDSSVIEITLERAPIPVLFRSETPATVLCDGAEWTSGGERCLLVPRTTVEALAAGPVHRITVTLIPR